MEYVDEVRVARTNRRTGEVRYKVILRIPRNGDISYVVLSAQFLATPGEPQLYARGEYRWVVYIYAADELQAAVRVNSALGALEET